jgi:uncharacterized protein (TIGR03083 family)
MAATIEDAAVAVERNAARFTSLLRAGLDPSERVHGSEWSVAQVATHLATGASAYEEMIAGNQSPYRLLDERAATNQARIDGESERDLRGLAEAIDDSVAKILTGARSLPAGATVPWHQDIEMPVRPFLGAMVGELAFHGQDIARSVAVPWTIARDDAFPVVDFIEVVTPHILDAAKTTGLSATVEVRVRGYGPTTYVFESSGLTVKPGGGHKRDVTMSVDAVAFLQVAYKRSTLTRPILTGKAVAWGRRPWVALQFPAFFQSP